MDLPPPRIFLDKWIQASPSQQHAVATAAVVIVTTLAIVRVLAAAETRLPLVPGERDGDCLRLRHNHSQHQHAAAATTSWDPSHLTKTNWSEGIDYEEKFWRHWFETQGSAWPQDYAERMQRTKKTRPLSSALKALTPQSALARGTVRILDAGAGPVTSIGTSCGDDDKQQQPTMQVDLTAADALAPLYQQMYRDFQVQPPVPTTIAADFEEIATVLGGQQPFDIVHVRNALDHSYNPILGIASMLKVVNPDCGVLYLVHAVAEGTRMAFAGFHKWDFLVENGNEFVISRPGIRYDVSTLFAAVANVNAKIVGGEVRAVFTKMSSNSEGVNGSSSDRRPCLNAVAGA